MKIKNKLTEDQLNKLNPLLVELVNYSVHDIKSFKELTSSEKSIFNNDESLFNEFFTDNTIENA